MSLTITTTKHFETHRLTILSLTLYSFHHFQLNSLQFGVDDELRRYNEEPQAGISLSAPVTAAGEGAGDGFQPGHYRGTSDRRH